MSRSRNLPRNLEERLLAIAGFVLIAVTVGLSLKSRSSSTVAPQPKSEHVSSHMPSHMSWREMEKGLGSLHRKDVDWFLLQTKIPGFEAELNRAEPARLPSEIKWIDGCHRGTVKLEDGRRWEMTTAISLEKGNTDVALSEKGNVFAHSIGSEGGRNGIRDLETFEGSAALILEASENIFFQFYPVREGGWIAGNLYLRSGDGKFTFGGTTLLARTECRNE